MERKSREELSDSGEQDGAGGETAAVTKYGAAAGEGGQGGMLHMKLMRVAELLPPPL